VKRSTFREKNDFAKWPLRRAHAYRSIRSRRRYYYYCCGDARGRKKIGNNILRKRYNNNTSNHILRRSNKSLLLRARRRRFRKRYCNTAQTALPRVRTCAHDTISFNTRVVCVVRVAVSVVVTTSGRGYSVTRAQAAAIYPPSRRIHRYIKTYVTPSRHT